MQPQNHAILRHLQSGPITAIQAMNSYGIFRLAARIHDLKQDGHAINSRIIQVMSRDGEPRRVAVYSLGAES